MPIHRLLLSISREHLDLIGIPFLRIEGETRVSETDQPAVQVSRIGKSPIFILRYRPQIGDRVADGVAEECEACIATSDRNDRSHASSYGRCHARAVTVGTEDKIVLNDPREREREGIVLQKHQLWTCRNRINSIMILCLV